VKKKEEKETARPGARKVKQAAPKATKPRASRGKTQKTPEGGQG
jgi:hypothetical protein